MKLVCLAKPVPDPRAALKLLPDASGVDPAGAKLVCDPFDEFALELAVQLKEKSPAGRDVTVISAGGPACTEVLRHALAMGCDRAVHVQDPGLAAWDELGLAAVLASAVRAAEPDAGLVLCGKQNIDNDAGELGPALAEFLGIPHVGAVCGATLADDAKSVRVRRRVEGAEETFEVLLPALLTIEKGLVEPRRPAIARIMKAKSQPITALAPGSLAGVAARGGAPSRTLGLPASRPACAYLTGEPGDVARELVRRLRDEARVL
jgi:electron transfer flavoprotein beta subunit